MNKRLISLVLTVCLFLALSIPASAKNIDKTNKVKQNTDSSVNVEMQNDPLYHSNRTIVNTQIFHPDNKTVQQNSQEIKSNSLTTSGGGDYVVAYLPGTVKIDDSMTDDSGFQPVMTKTGMWETIKFATTNILPYIPLIGQMASTCLTIKDGIVAVYTDIANFDTSKTTDIITRYVYRYFYHTGYVMGEDNQWAFEGESTSKYYYKVQTFDAIVNGTFTTRTRCYIVAEGFGPTAISKAPNYMNYTALSNIFYEKWVTQQPPYYETY